MKGGRFRIVLVSPATSELVERYASEIDSVCDEFHWWTAPERGPAFSVTRMRHIVREIPIPVYTDKHAEGHAMVAEFLSAKPDVVVFDFAHAGVLMPDEPLSSASVMFTHNVEAEIFKRHAKVAGNPLFRAIWKNQYEKMLKF